MAAAAAATAAAAVIVVAAVADTIADDDRVLSYLTHSLFADEKSSAGLFGDVQSSGLTLLFYSS